MKNKELMLTRDGGSTNVRKLKCDKNGNWSTFPPRWSTFPTSKCTHMIDHISVVIMDKFIFCHILFQLFHILKDGVGYLQDDVDLYYDSSCNHHN